MNKKYIVCFLVIIIVMFVGNFVYRFNMTPIEVVNKDRNASNGVFTISKVLYESFEADDKYIIIYKNPHGNICNVLLEESWNGYNIVDFNGEMECENASIPVSMLFG